MYGVSMGRKIEMEHFIRVLESSAVLEIHVLTAYINYWNSHQGTHTDLTANHFEKHVMKNRLKVLSQYTSIMSTVCVTFLDLI
jgi:hypothetical protein